MPRLQKKIKSLHEKSNFLTVLSFFNRGKFASVRKIRHLVSGQEYAAKFIRKRRRAADTSREIYHEVAVLALCGGCTRVVRLHEVRLRISGRIIAPFVISRNTSTPGLDKGLPQGFPHFPAQRPSALRDICPCSDCFHGVVVSPLAFRVLFPETYL